MGCLFHKKNTASYGRVTEFFLFVAHSKASKRIAKKSQLWGFSKRPSNSLEFITFGWKGDGVSSLCSPQQGFEASSEEAAAVGF